MAVRKKAGTVKAPEAGDKGTTGQTGAKGKKADDAKAPKAPSAAATSRYQVPKDVRKPRENSIIEAIYKAVEPNFGSDDCNFDQVATGAEICDAIADKLKKPKGEDATYTRSDVLSTLRWLLGKQRIIKVGDEEAE